MTGKIRIYKDNEGAIQAQTLKTDDELDAQAVVFRVHLPIGHVMAELLFTDMTPHEAQTLGLKDTETLYRALGREGSRVGLQDTNEEYYMLQFQLHPVIDKKEKNRIAKKLGEALEKAGGWLNPIVVTVAPYTYRYDLVVSDADKTQQAIARVLKNYGQVTDFDFHKNDF